jgi:soluble lytic murein transglycosylase-like protein
VAAALLLGGASLALWLNLQPTAAAASTAPPGRPASPPRPGQASGESAPRAIAAAFTPEVRAWEPFILQWAAEHGLDPNLVAVVIQIESCGDPWAQSGAGALGLFQVMPYHFREGEDPLAPLTNARRGLAYLARALQLAEGDPALALAGYNGGHGVISRPRHQWPAQTQRYVYWGEGILQDVARGRNPSPRLQEWLAAGGRSLCRRAAQALKLDGP